MGDEAHAAAAAAKLFAVEASTAELEAAVEAARVEAARVEAEVEAEVVKSVRRISSYSRSFSVDAARESKLGWSPALKLILRELGTLRERELLLVALLEVHPGRSTLVGMLDRASWSRRES